MAQFDGLALINAVTELSELLGKRSTVDEFLQDLTVIVAEHLRADVCSVYLYDVEQDLLVLRATMGLNPTLVGKVRLHSGEGLTGYAFLNNSPVLEHQADNSTLNKPIPDLGEEEYPVFLGVPIKRNNLGIGVLTLQYRADDGIGEQELRTLRSLASHLAAALENAAALYELHEAPPTESHSSGVFESGLINGTSASRGIAIGHLEYLDQHLDILSHPSQRTLEEAIDVSSSQLEELQRHVDETLSDVAAMIFSSHLLMLRDDSFVGEMYRIHQEGTDPVTAVQQVVDDFSRRFMSIPDPRFQEKVQDVQDLGHRIVRNLQQRDEHDGDYRGHVVAAHDLFPSELVKLYLQNVEGLAFSGGGATSHVAILAQSLNLPVVATADPRLFSATTGTQVVIDAEDGKIVVRPGKEILDAYRSRISALGMRRLTASEEPLPDILRTSDGAVISLFANVNLVKDARAAHQLNAAGVGLYRSEFPFLIRNGFPTEDEQVAVYQRVVDETAGKPVSFRTLDLGGDKLLSSQVGREDNPFLGFRGIRFLLEHRELFREQLRAMLRAGTGIELGIQFPMIASLDEFLAARNEVHICIDQLAREGVAHNRSPRLGVMIELPSAIDIAPELAEVTDYLSIGTNDLIMYMLAADRTNHRVGELYRTVHPAVLRAIARLMDAVAPSGIPISVCGAAATDPAMIAFFLGVGIRSLSVDPDGLTSVAEVIQRTSVADAQEIARRMRATADRPRLAELAEAVRSQFH
ncbi:MAG: phosphoenolpyruvate--protein phosphotransferase [Alkalispirochaeta sp.]